MNSYINKFHYDASKYSRSFEVACLVAYWSEGSKYPKMVEITNSDPKMLEMFSVFLLHICNIEPAKLKGRLQIHEGNSIEKAKTFWSKLCNVNEKDIIVSNRKIVDVKNNKHPYGIFSIRYNSVGLKSLLDFKLEELKKVNFKA